MFIETFSGDTVSMCMHIGRGQNNLWLIPYHCLNIQMKKGKQSSCCESWVGPPQMVATPDVLYMGDEGKLSHMTSIRNYAPEGQKHLAPETTMR